MGYWGTIVVGRSERLLVEQEALLGFGYRHHWLRELGDGWQLVETGGWDDGPALAGSAAELAASTGEPVWAAYVCDSDCFAMCAATVDGAGPLTHLPGVATPCQVYDHGPGSASSAVDDVIAELTAWSAAAGLDPDVDKLHTYVAEGHPSTADDLAFDLVKALGVKRIGRTLPWALPVTGIPFRRITGYGGPAWRAHVRAVTEEPAEPWDADAIALDSDLWAALYQRDADIPELLRRTAEFLAARRATRPSRPRDVEDEEFLAPFLDGTRPPFDTDESNRRWADRRAL